MEYTQISKDCIKVYGFCFGKYRYQVEHYDHNKTEGVKHDNSDILKCKNYWDTLYGTKVYRFYDSKWDPMIHTALFENTYIEKEELKKLILDDSIDWKKEDPYDFKDLFIMDEHSTFFYYLFHREKEPVKLNYPECKHPYEKCPICGEYLNDDDLDLETAVDVFNGHSSYVGEYTSSTWDEVHRCSHCGELFYIKEEN